MAKSEDLKSLEEIKEQIRKDFSFITKEPNILGIFLFGSAVYKEHHQQSDIDICVVSSHKQLVKAYNFIMENLSSHLQEYDIRFFRELPLTIQGEIMEHGIPILSRDIYELYEYLFPYRKQYEDWKFKVKYCI